MASTVIDAVIDDPTAIWRSNAVTQALDLTATEKAQVISAFVQGFHTIFHVHLGLIGFNLILAVVFIERHDLRRKDEEALFVHLSSLSSSPVELTFSSTCRKQKGKDWVQHRKDKKHGGDKEDEAEKGVAASTK